MKYISMKMEPKGRMPVAAMITLGLVYQGPRGMGRAMELTRQGKSALPAQCLLVGWGGGGGGYRVRLIGVRRPFLPARSAF